MKARKYFAAALLVALSVVLPGCGKSKDNKGLVGGPINNFAYTPGAGGGGCAQVGVQGNGVASFPISGAAQIGVSGFTSQASVGGNGIGQGGAHYIRTNTSGDTVDVYLAGGVNSQGALNGVVTLSSLTVGALGGQIQPLVVCQVLFNNTGVNASGQLYGTIILYTQYGAVAL